MQQCCGAAEAAGRRFRKARGHGRGAHFCGFSAASSAVVAIVGDGGYSRWAAP